MLKTLKLLGKPEYFPELCGTGYINLTVLTEEGEILGLTVWIEVTDELRTPYLGDIAVNVWRTKTGLVFTIENSSTPDIREAVTALMYSERVFKGFDDALQDVLGNYDPVDW